MDYCYALMDLTVHGRQESWEDSPAGWPAILARYAVGAVELVPV